MARHMGDFLSQYPDVELEIIASNEDKEVYSSDVDLCIRYGESRWRDREVTLISHPELFPVVSPALMNGANGIRTLEDLTGHTLFCQHAGSWKRWFAAATSAKVGKVRILQMGSPHIGIEAALHGQGVALGDSLANHDDLMDGTLIRPFSATVPSKYAYYWVIRPELEHSPLVTAFQQWVYSKIA